MHLQRECEPLRAAPEPDAAHRACLGETGEDVADGSDNGLVGVEAGLAIGFAPAKADRQSSAELTTCCLVANAAIEAGPQHMQLGFAHGALEPEQRRSLKRAG